MGAAHHDDHQIRRQVWEVGGVDRAEPRVEIEVLALSAADVEHTTTTA